MQYVMYSLLFFFFIFWPVCNAMIFTGLRKAYPDVDLPWNWRVLTGPWLYMDWLDEKQRTNK